MNAIRASRFARHGSTVVVLAFSLALSTGLMIGCGGSGSQMGGTPPGGNTQVVVLRTSTANDQLVSFQAFLASIALVDKAGNSVTVFTTPFNFGPLGEWMNLNGISAPLPAASVPSGTYTSAVVTLYGCSFTTITFNTTANQFSTSTSEEGTCSEGAGTATVNLPNPIKIAGSVIGLSLNLQVSQSYSVDATAEPLKYTIDPVFTLTPVIIAIAPQPTDESNGKVTVIDAQVKSLGADGKTIMLETADGIALTVVSNATTVFQGVTGGFSSLATNMIFNFDAAIQSDGSLLATRIEVPDAMTVASVGGPFTLPVIAPAVFSTLSLDQNGCTIVQAPFCGNIYHLNNTVFNVSGELTNLANLPIPASFASSNFLQGQNVLVTSSGVPGFESVEEALTLTLLPQTVNGTVSGVSNEGGFAVYTVTLAPYDLIPVLQNFTSNTPPPHLSNPSTIIVYADTHVSFLNSGTIAVGSVIRARGAIFDDNGTARMDAIAIYDGVPE
jgi:hypothetical protein